MTQPYVTPQPPVATREIPDQQELAAMLGLIAPDVSGTVPDFMLGLLPALADLGYEIVRAPGWRGLHSEPVTADEPPAPVVIRDES